MPKANGAGKLSGITSEKISDHPTCQRWVLDERRLTSAIGDSIHPAMIKSSLEHVVKRTTSSMRPRFIETCKWSAARRTEGSFVSACILRRKSRHDCSLRAWKTAQQCMPECGMGHVRNDLGLRGQRLDLLARS